MGRRSPDGEELARQLASLSSLSSEELKDRWAILFGVDAPPKLGRLLMQRAIGYQMQVKAFGGLAPATCRLLNRIVEGCDAAAAVPPAARLLPGTRLLREWGGSMHEVIILEEGVLYHGRRYRSLSVVAKKITGAHWSGPRFFGLNGKAAA